MEITFTVNQVTRIQRRDGATVWYAVDSDRISMPSDTMGFHFTDSEDPHWTPGQRVIFVLKNDK